MLILLIYIRLSSDDLSVSSIMQNMGSASKIQTLIANVL